MRKRASIIIAIVLIPFALFILVLAIVRAFDQFVGLGERSETELAQDIADIGLIAHTIGGTRPATLVLPSNLDPQTPVPLVLVLHGYGGFASDMIDRLNLLGHVGPKRFALLLPDGQRDDENNRFWNATDFCCGKTDAKPDDAAYLTGLTEEAAQFASIERILAIGYSNGGFMAYRLACDNMPGLQGIASIAGSSFSDPSRCDSANPVSVLHIHGDHDQVVKVEGGSNPDIGPGEYPAASDVVHRWAERGNCRLTPEDLSFINIDISLDGKETLVTAYHGCQDHLTMHLWSIQGGAHSPFFTLHFVSWVLDWLFRQGKPELAKGI